MWNEMTSCVKREVKESHGESKGCGDRLKRIEREGHRSLPICRDNAAYENNKVAKRELKKGCPRG
jgi:hypothetical protein